MIKFSIVLCTLLLAFSQTVASPAAESTQVAFDGQWDFTYTAPSDAKSFAATIPELPPASAYDAKIDVPGRWDEQLDRFKHTAWWPKAVFKTSLGPVQYLSGTGWHRRWIDVPKSWGGRAAKLTVGSAVGTTHGWLNGEHLGTNQTGVYAPYEIDLTGKLIPGQKNELVIAVDNAAENPFGGWALMGNSGNASGLARPVTLEIAAGPGRIADLYIKPGADLKEVVWEADLTMPGEKRESSASKIEWIVRDLNGRQLGHGDVSAPAFSAAHRLTWKARLDEIQPWSDRHPNLYQTEIRWLASDGQLLDVRQQRFGLRRWSYEGRKLFLNGEPMFLRLEFGAFYFPREGAVSTSKQYWLHHMRRLKELGLNGINFAAQVCPIEMLEAADELGVILQCGDEVTAKEETRPYLQQVWEPIVRTTRRYPSMAIYGFGGENKYYEGVIEQYKLQRDFIHSLHPESLVMPQQAIHAIDYSLEEGAPGVVKKPFVHHAERLARYTEACDLFGHFSGSAFSHSYFRISWREMETRFQIYKKPLVAHEIVISGSYLSPDNAPKYTGRIPPYIYTRLEGDLKEAGMLEKWPIYFENTSRLLHLCRKYCMEKVRKCDGLAGFEMLGMMDMHFITPEYTVGLVDEFLAMKPGETLEGVRRYSNESVVLLDFDNGNGINRCYSEGQPFEATIMASLYGSKPIHSGKLTWRLSRDGKTVLEGSRDVADVANGKVSSLEKLKFEWPKTEQTAKLNLAVELEGAGRSLANDWDFWVFPKQAPPAVAAAADRNSLKLLQRRYADITPLTAQSSEPLRIVSRLSAGDIEHLNRGGDVVLLGAEPFTRYTQWPRFEPPKGFRPFSNGGTIIAQHPILAGHPHEGWNDWLFYPLMQSAPSILFDDAIPMQFDPIIEIISSPGHVRKQALLFEQRVGKGRLLVTTLVFDLRNPSCATLMDTLLRYAQSGEFQPSHSVDVDRLLRAASPADPGGNMLPDPSFEKTGYWVTDGGEHQLDPAVAHDGKKSMQLTVTQQAVDSNRNAASGVSARRMDCPKDTRRLKLSGWFKTDELRNLEGLTVKAVLRLVDAHIRSETISISPTESSADWKYVEKIVEYDAQPTVAEVFIELTGGAGTVWVDDLYFGPADGEAR